MSRLPRREFVVPVMLGDERLVTVMARDTADAKARVKAGRYKSLGPSRGRGFLTIGEPVEKVRGSA